MTDIAGFLASLLDMAARGVFFPERLLWERTGYSASDFDAMIAGITTGAVNAGVCLRDRDSVLFKMTTKSLALVTMLINGQDEAVFARTHKTKAQLKSCLEALWGAPITPDEYAAILNPR
jgi:hypothetical protein